MKRVRLEVELLLCNTRIARGKDSPSRPGPEARNYARPQLHWLLQCFILIAKPQYQGQEKMMASISKIMFVAAVPIVVRWDLPHVHTNYQRLTPICGCLSPYSFAALAVEFELKLYTGACVLFRVRSSAWIGPVAILCGGTVLLCFLQIDRTSYLLLSSSSRYLPRSFENRDAVCRICLFVRGVC